MKKILLITLILTSIAGYSQIKETQKENQQSNGSGDIIIESFEGEMSDGPSDTNPDKPVNYDALEVKPQYPGGEDALKKYIIDNVQKKNLKDGAAGKELKVIFFVHDRKRRHNLVSETIKRTRVSCRERNDARFKDLKNKMVAWYAK